jgi:soluble lytic murein transglycosylase-like protein
MRRRNLINPFRIIYFMGAVLFISLLVLGYQTDKVYKLEVETKQERTQEKQSYSVRKVSAYYMETNPKLWPQLATYMAEATIDASIKYKVPLKLVVGIVSGESDASPFAVSHTGAKGSTQVDFKAHAEDFPGVRKECDRYDPRINIACGTYLLSGYLKTHSVRNSLQIYNLGATAFSKGKRNNKYVTTVLGNATDYEYFRP